MFSFEISVIFLREPQRKIRRSRVLGDFSDFLREKQRKIPRRQIFSFKTLLFSLGKHKGKIRWRTFFDLGYFLKEIQRKIRRRQFLLRIELFPLGKHKGSRRDQASTPRKETGGEFWADRNYPK